MKKLDTLVYKFHKIKIKNNIKQEILMGSPVSFYPPEIKILTIVIVRELIINGYSSEIYCTFT